MRIVNIVHDGSKVNMGVWSSAMSTASELRRSYGVLSELWYPAGADVSPEREDHENVPLKSTRLDYLKQIVEKRALQPGSTILCVHGGWRFPTRWAHHLGQKGFKWIYTPHGHLNKYGFAQKSFKKTIYFRFFERKMVERADVIRAVGGPERDELVELFTKHPNIRLIPNGMPKHVQDLTVKETEPRIVLFMSRLFKGKGVVPMVRAWLKSNINNHPGFRLLIAGPDQGELPTIQQLLQDHPDNSIEYIGPIYGEDKKRLLNRASFFILPTWSETFSMAVLEGMAYGLVPVITPQCNFPEVFTNNLGIKITIEEEGIRSGLEALLGLNSNQILDLQFRNTDFIFQNYTLEHIAKLQFQCFRELLAANKVAGF